MNILLSAYSCAPDQGSEPGAGWQWLLAAGSIGQVTALVNSNSVAALSAALAAEPVNGTVDLVPVPLSRRQQRWIEAGRFERIVYLIWQRRARHIAQALLRCQRFDVVHHVTFGSDWLYAGVAGLACPFVWGPVGGSTFAGFQLTRRSHGNWIPELMRGPAIALGRRAWTRKYVKTAGYIFAQNNDAKAGLEALGVSCPVEVFPHVALETEHLHRIASATEPQCRLLVFVGRLVAWKGVHLALEALKRLPDDWRLEFIGDGPERRKLESRARLLGVAGRVTFRGQLPRHGTLQRLAGAAALLFPSLHDSAGWVVAEAQAMGRPVVCLDIAGPPCLINRQTSAAIPPHGSDLAQALAEGVLSVRPGACSDRWDRSRIPTALKYAYEVAAFGGQGKIMTREPPSGVNG